MLKSTYFGFATHNTRTNTCKHKKTYIRIHMHAGLHVHDKITKARFADFLVSRYRAS